MPFSLSFFRSFVPLSLSLSYVIISLLWRALPIRFFHREGKLVMLYFETRWMKEKNVSNKQEGIFTINGCRLTDERHRFLRLSWRKSASCSYLRCRTMKLVFCHASALVVLRLCSRHRPCLSSFSSFLFSFFFLHSVVYVSLTHIHTVRHTHPTHPRAHSYILLYTECPSRKRANTTGQSTPT